MSQRAITQLEPGADPDGFEGVRESNIDLGASHGPKGMYTMQRGFGGGLASSTRGKHADSGMRTVEARNFEMGSIPLEFDDINNRTMQSDLKYMFTQGSELEFELSKVRLNPINRLNNQSGTSIDRNLMIPGKRNIKKGKKEAKVN